MSRGTLSPATLCQVILHSISVQRSNLADVHEPNEPNSKQPSQDHFTRTALSVYIYATWPVKVTQPKYIQHNPHHPPIYSKVTILITCIPTEHCQGAERDDSLTAHLMSYMWTFVLVTKRGHPSETQVCVLCMCVSVEKNTMFSCSPSVSDPVPRLMGHLVLTTCQRVSMCSLISNIKWGCWGRRRYLYL